MALRKIDVTKNDDYPDIGPKVEISSFLCIHKMAILPSSISETV